MTNYNDEPRGWVSAFGPWPERAFVSDINNSGDMYGTATKGGVMVPTMWRNGVPYDLTDPANAGTVFDYDPGPKRLATFGNHDLLTLNVLDLPSLFLPRFCSECPSEPPFDYGYGINVIAPIADIRPYALTNARGDIVFEYTSAYSRWSSYGILRAIPEPTTAWLIAVASFGIFVSGRRAAGQRGDSQHC